MMNREKSYGNFKKPKKIIGLDIPRKVTFLSKIRNSFLCADLVFDFGKAFNQDCTELRI